MEMKSSARTMIFATMVAALVVPLAIVVRPGAALASNPFCGADASYVPWDVQTNAPAPRTATTESAIRVVLYTSTTSTANALITFITSDSAYQAVVAGVPMHATTAGGDYQSDPLLVKFATPVDVAFAYVDSFATNGGAMSSCPSFVNQVDAFGAPPRPYTAPPSLHAIPGSPAPSMPARYTVATAALLQPLPSLTCGAVYKPAHMALRPQSDWSFQDEAAGYGGLYGNEPRSTSVIGIAINSDGRPLLAQIVHSSGNSVTDQEALDQARTVTYTPAQFLCTPVVSLLFYEYTQK